MALGNLAQEARTADASVNKLAENRSAVTVCLGPTPYEGIIVTDCAAGKRGVKVRLKSAPDLRGLTLENAINGKVGLDGKIIHATAPNDVIVFESAYLDGDTLICGKIAGRIHDGIEGRVQIMKALVRASFSSVSKRGITQYACIADPAAAKMVRSREDVEGMVRSQFAREFPGGRRSFFIRSKTGSEEFQFDDGEKPDAYIRRLVDANKVLEGGPFEMMPIFHMHMGREQILREGLNPKEETRGQAQGNISKLYASQGRTGFLPSLLIVCDEEEWAFGGKTGKTIRVAACVDPLMLVTPGDKRTFTTENFKFGNKARQPYQLRELYSANELDAMAAARKSRATANAKSRQTQTSAPASKLAPPPNTRATSEKLAPPLRSPPCTQAQEAISEDLSTPSLQR